ncbi:MAG: DUF3999 family protein [Candidatus Sumerlaeaceae bacterium]
MKSAALITAALVGLCASTVGAFDDKHWTWQRALEVPQTTGFITVPITHKVFDESNLDLADLRVLDGARNPVPHLITWTNETGSAKITRKPVQLLNATYQPGQFARVTLDFGAPETKNEIHVRVPGRNFRRKAMIEGSTDAQSWETVAQDLWLFDVSVQEKSFKADTLRFPANNFRYLRLTVFNMPDDPEHIAIEEASATHFEAASSTGTEALALRQMSEEQDTKTKQTAWTFDAGWRNLPIMKVAFSFNDPYFHRAFELYGRNSTTEILTMRTETGVEQKMQATPWAHVDSGVMYRILEGSGPRESLVVQQMRIPYRYLKLAVSNQDNPPLHLDSAVASVAHAKLIFAADPKQRYILIGGNRRTGQASYDLPHAVRNLSPAALPVANIGEATLLAHKPELAPWTERHSSALLGALVVAVAFMLGLVFSSMRKMPGPPGP